MHVWQQVMDAGVSLGALDWLRPRAGILGDTSNLFFFKEIYDFLSDEIDEFRDNVLGRTMAFVGGLALIMLTIWVMLQGYRLATGQSRDNAMVMIINALRATLIVAVATSFAVAGSPISDLLTDDFNRQITYLMTGEKKNSTDDIDESLGYMQIALSSIDQLDVGGDEILNETKTRNQWFTGIGIAGPAVTGGAMLLLYKIAMALIVGLGPFFVLCLLFDLTKQMFHKWLWFGIGTLFSLAVLNAMVTLSLDAVLAVAGAFWVGDFVGANNEGVTSIALQQGGLGLILSTLIIGAPPMAAMFFQGTMANFAAYNALGNMAGQGAGGMRPDGRGGMVPMNNANYGPATDRPTTTNYSTDTRAVGSDYTAQINRVGIGSGQTQSPPGIREGGSRVVQPSPPSV